LLTAFARKIEIDELGDESKTSQNTYWYCSDSLNWEHNGFFAKPFHWCWRLSWHGQHICSLAYAPQTESLHLYRGSELGKLKADPSPGILPLNNSRLLIKGVYEHFKITSLTKEKKQAKKYFCGSSEISDYITGEFKTGLFKPNLQQFPFLLPLPSAYDNGYPGAVIDKKDLNETGL